MHTPGAKVAEHQPNVRAAERFDLEVTVDLESDHNFYTGLTQNISSGGVFIATHHLRRIGDRITLKFTLPGSEKVLDVETEVRWIRENTALLRTADGGTPAQAAPAWASASSTFQPKPPPRSTRSWRAANRCTTTTRTRPSLGAVLASRGRSRRSSQRGSRAPYARAG